jgi:putative ABC transport system ATP-binding protein
VFLDGRDLQSLDETARAQLRRDTMGFVFQFFNLLPTLTALENIRLPLDLAGVDSSSARARAKDVIARVGLSVRSDHFPEHLSGGEMQRVAVARALIGNPRLVFADEPTGNLDSETGLEILNLLAQGSEDGRALVMVTHDPAALRIATRVLNLRDGRLSEPGTSP